MPKLEVRQTAKLDLTAYQGYVRFEIDTFVMDNSDTEKEDVGRTLRWASP